MSDSNDDIAERRGCVDLGVDDFRDANRYAFAKFVKERSGPIDPDEIPDDSRNPERLAAANELLEQGHRRLGVTGDEQGAVMSGSDKKRMGYYTGIQNLWEDNEAVRPLIDEIKTLLRPEEKLSGMNGGGVQDLDVFEPTERAAFARAKVVRDLADRHGVSDKIRVVVWGGTDTWGKRTSWGHLRPKQPRA